MPVFICDTLFSKSYFFVRLSDWHIFSGFVFYIELCKSLRQTCLVALMEILDCNKKVISLKLYLACIKLFSQCFGSDVSYRHATTDAPLKIGNHIQSLESNLHGVIISVPLDYVRCP